MSKFWKNNKNVISVGLSLFVVSVTALMVVLNNEHLATDMKTTIIHEKESHLQPAENSAEYGPFFAKEDGPAVIVGMDGLIEYANQKFKETADLNSDAVKGELFFSYIHPEDLAGVLSAYGKVLSSKEPQVLVGPFRMKNSADEYAVQMAAMQPVIKEDKMTGVAVKMRSISADSVPVKEIEIEYQTVDGQQTPDTVNPAEEASEKTEYIKHLIEEIVENKEVKGSENGNKPDLPPVKKDKQIRNESNDDKRLVVDNLTKAISRVYRAPDPLAFLY